jgi:hypothetical protein
VNTDLAPGIRSALAADPELALHYVATLPAR